MHPSRKLESEEAMDPRLVARMCVGFTTRGMVCPPHAFVPERYMLEEDRQHYLLKLGEDHERSPAYSSDFAVARKFIDDRIGGNFAAEDRSEMLGIITRAIYHSNLHKAKHKDETFVLEWCCGKVKQFKNIIHIVILASILDIRILCQTQPESMEEDSMENHLKEFLITDPDGAEFLVKVNEILTSKPDKPPHAVQMMGLALMSMFLTEFRDRGETLSARLSQQAMSLLDNEDEDVLLRGVKYEINKENPISTVRNLLFDMFHIAVFGRMPHYGGPKSNTIKRTEEEVKKRARTS